MWSHPTMGAWIEIAFSKSLNTLTACRTPRWVRGLKLHWYHLHWLLQWSSHPTMGAWIEMVSSVVWTFQTSNVTSRIGVRGLKWDLLFRNKLSNRCRPPRRMRGLKSKRIHAGIKKSKLNAKKRLEWGNIQVFFSAFLFVYYYSINCNRYQ